MSPSHSSASIDIGEEVVEAITRAVRGMPPGAIVVATGEVEDAEVLGLRNGERVRRVLAGPSDLVSLTGYVEAGRAELRAVLAREGEAGAQVMGGVLARALSVSVRFHVLAPSAVAPSAVAPSAVAPSAVAPSAGQPQLAAVEPAAAPAPAAASTPGSSAPATPALAPSRPALITPPPAASAPRAVVTQPEASAIPAPQPRPPLAPSPDLTTALPPKIHRRSTEPDEFPEENDVVTHFHFGRCVVLSSDGERLRLQQEKDSRVREVALSMLRIDTPTMLEDGRRHWELARKN